MTNINTHALSELQKKLQDHEAFFIEDPFDLFYILKKPISLGTLLVEKTNVHLFVDGRYFSAFGHFKDILTMRSENDGLKNYLKKQTLKTIFFDSTHTSYQRGLSLKSIPSVHFEAKEDLLKSLRLIKSQEEISLIRQSALLLVSIYEDFLKLPKIGLTEKQIARQFQTLSFEKGADGFSFDPIIATGENTAYPHHRPTDRVLQDSGLMLVDIGVTKNGYQSDMTRMVFLGHVNPLLLKFHDRVLEAQQAAMRLCKPGTKVGALDKAARDVFQKYDCESLFCHSLGHGLGLETHEAPRIKYEGVDHDMVLQAGMVITLEPGLYQEGLGGIRHEDLIVITDSGYENFYPSFI
jgi:Xaa-Pro aminopeptidase